MANKNKLLTFSLLYALILFTCNIVTEPKKHNSNKINLMNIGEIVIFKKDLSVKINEIDKLQFKTKISLKNSLNKTSKEKLLLAKSLFQRKNCSNNINILLLNESCSSSTHYYHQLINFFSSNNTRNFRGFLVDYVINKWYDFNIVLIFTPNLINLGKTDKPAIKSVYNFIKYLNINTVLLFHDKNFLSDRRNQSSVIKHIDSYLKESLNFINTYLMVRDNTLSLLLFNKNLKLIKNVFSNLIDDSISLKYYWRDDIYENNYIVLLDVLQELLTEKNLVQKYKKSDQLFPLFKKNIRRKTLSIFANLSFVFLLDICFEILSGMKYVKRNKLISQIERRYY